MATPLEENPSRKTSRSREAAKWLLWRILPRRTYQKVLARSKAQDFESRAFREPELDLLPLVAREGGTAVDVGANHGMWTRAMSRAVGDTGHVIAFEPVPFTFGTLEALVDRLSLDNVELVNAGCSDHGGTSEFVIPKQDTGATDDLQAHLADRRDPEPDGPAESVRCELVRLDDALEEADHIDVMKLDIEGAELDALKGGVRTLERHHPVLITEVDAGFLGGFGHSTDELEGFLRSFGYSPWHYRADDGTLEPLESLAMIKHANVVFLPGNGRERLSEVIA